VLVVAIATLVSSHAQAAGSQQTIKSYTAADVTSALSRAEQFRREGKYKQALELHVWYHKNALKYDPAQYGVRLSFALSDWAELGQAYPPALHELRSVRNDTLTTYKKNPSDALMYGEVMSIDLALDDLQSANALFYLGQRSGVNDDSLMLDLDRILQTGDLKWISDVIGDPSKKLDAFKHERETALAALSGRKDLAKGLDEMYASQVANLLRAVAKVNGLPAARKLQKKALTFLDSPTIRNALNIP